MAALLLFSLILFSLLSLSSPLPSQTILNAAAVLSDSGFVSMALTLEVVSQTLIPSSQSVTIFSPSDEAFTKSGQPPLSVLQLHFSPLTFSPQSLRSLPYGTKIPTIFSGHSLIVTTSASDGQISLNNVTVNASPIYDDGSLIIFGVDKFFDPQFQVSASVQSSRPNLGCRATKERTDSGSYSLDAACGILRSRGYSVMASFLDLQLLGFEDQPKLTVFAPSDDVMIDHVGDFSEYSSLFLRHVLPCKLTWTDLVNFDDTTTTLRTSLEGFAINVTRSGDILMLNEIPVVSPDMYFNDWLVVHGLREILKVPDSPEEAAESSLGIGRRNNEDRVPDHGEF